MALECLNGEMGGNMWGNGKKEGKMEKDCILMKRRRKKLGFGWMEKELNG